MIIPENRGVLWQFDTIGGPVDDVICQLLKFHALRFQTKRYLQFAFLKPFYNPHNLLMQPTRTV